MKIGFPTYPRNDIIEEIRWIGNNGFDFADLFFEADKAEADQIDPAAVRSALDQYGLDCVGHTPWYLPIGSPSRALRASAVEILKQYVLLCSRIPCSKLTVHGNWAFGLFTAEEAIGYQTESLQTLATFAGGYGVTIMYESINTPRDSVKNIRKILELNPEVDFHADIGHLNLYGKDPAACLVELKDRLSHVHLHDNNGQTDLHLPMGAGMIRWDHLIKTLKSFYDGTITLEVFAPDRAYALLTKEKLLEKWQSA